MTNIISSQQTPKQDVFEQGIGWMKEIQDIKNAKEPKPAEFLSFLQTHAPTLKTSTFLLKDCNTVATSIFNAFQTKDCDDTFLLSAVRCFCILAGASHCIDKTMLERAKVVAHKIINTHSSEDAKNTLFSCCLRVEDFVAAETLLGEMKWKELQNENDQSHVLQFALKLVEAKGATQACTWIAKNFDEKTALDLCEHLAIQAQNVYQKKHIKEYIMANMVTPSQLISEQGIDWLKEIQGLKNAQDPKPDEFLTFLQKHVTVLQTSIILLDNCKKIAKTMLNNLNNKNVDDKYLFSASRCFCLLSDSTNANTVANKITDNKIREDAKIKIFNHFVTSAKYSNAEELLSEMKWNELQTAKDQFLVLHFALKIVEAEGVPMACGWIAGNFDVKTTIELCEKLAIQVKDSRQKNHIRGFIKTQNEQTQNTIEN